MRVWAIESGDGGAAAAELRLDAFERNVRHNADAAYRHALWLLRDPLAAEDAVQEAFLRAWQAARTPLGPDDFRPWLHRIVANICRNQVRRQRVLQGLRLARPPAEDPLAEFERRQGDPELVEAVRRLAPRDRSAIFLFYYEDRPASEIATVLGISEGAARVVLHRAVQRLRTILVSPGSQAEVATDDA